MVSWTHLPLMTVVSNAGEKVRQRKASSWTCSELGILFVVMIGSGWISHAKVWPIVLVNLRRAVEAAQHFPVNIVNPINP